MPMVFPSSPAVGQVFSSGGRSWVWNGSTWDSPRTDNIQNLPSLSGGNTFTGVQNFTTPIAVPSGGTGAATLASGGYLKGAGTSSITSQAGIPAGDITSGLLNHDRMPAGSILQVVSVIKTNTFTSTSSSFVDVTGLSATIAPRFSDSRILVVVNIFLGGAATLNCYGRLVRGNTLIGNGDASGSRIDSFALVRPPDNFTAHQSSHSFLDSPNTTAATNYRVQVGSNANGFALHVNRNNDDQSNSNSPRAASTITLFEVAV